MIPHANFGALRALLATLGFAASLDASAMQPPRPWDVLIVDAIVVDPRDGAQMPGRSIAIDRGRIVAITEGVPRYPARGHLQAEGRYALPCACRSIDDALRADGNETFERLRTMDPLEPSSPAAVMLLEQAPTDSAALDPAQIFALIVGTEVWQRER